MTAPIRCAHCGNDGSQAGLYLTIDARHCPELGGWRLQLMEDGGGRELDCMGCDKTTPVDQTVFPYGMIVAGPTAPLASE